MSPFVTVKHRRMLVSLQWLYRQEWTFTDFSSQKKTLNLMKIVWNLASNFSNSMIRPLLSSLDRMDSYSLQARSQAGYSFLSLITSSFSGSILALVTGSTAWVSTKTIKISCLVQTRHLSSISTYNHQTQTQSFLSWVLMQTISLR